MSGNIIQLNEQFIHNELKTIVKNSVEETLNALLDAEADKLVQAERYAREQTRKGYRAGHYERSFSTQAGDVTLKVPKLKGLTFESAIIQRYQRRECSVEEALAEMYLAGVSMRRVESITEILWGQKVSAGTISNLNEKTPEAFCKKYDESYSDDFSSDAANIFECLFCYRFGYPFGCFKGISDYDGTIMFFCNAQYSPKTYNKKFGELTEAIFIKELREFFYELFKDDYYKTVELELCEEYIKE